VIHTGGDDYSISYDQVGKYLLDCNLIIRWIIEQNNDERISNNDKVIQLPIGFCAREMTHQVGNELDLVLRKLNTTINDLVNPSLTNIEVSTASRRRISVVDNNTSSISSVELDKPQETVPEKGDLLKYHRVLEHIVRHALPYKKRLNRIFFCFHTGYVNRMNWMTFAKENCTICDICDTSMTHYDLWMTYTQYKYVFAPRGNGVDCFRNFEIVLLGSIPIMEYFAGSRGYKQAGIKVVEVYNTTDITEGNRDLWDKRFRNGTEREYVTRDYWNKYAFNL
jgi:hypothetical protein